MSDKPSDLRVLHLVSGETVIGKVREMSPGEFALVSPYQLVPMQAKSPDGSEQIMGRIMVMPWFPSVIRNPRHPIHLQKSAVTAVCMPNPEVEEMYRRQTSDIVLAHTMPPAGQGKGPGKPPSSLIV